MEFRTWWRVGALAYLSQDRGHPNSRQGCLVRSRQTGRQAVAVRRVCLRKTACEEKTGNKTTAAGRPSPVLVSPSTPLPGSMQDPCRIRDGTRQDPYRIQGGSMQDPCRIQGGSRWSVDLMLWLIFVSRPLPCVMDLPGSQVHMCDGPAGFSGVHISGSHPVAQDHAWVSILQLLHSLQLVKLVKLSY